MHSDLIIFIILLIAVVIILISAYYSKPRPKPSHFLINNTTQKNYEKRNVRENVKDRGYSYDKSYNSKSYLNTILRNKILIIELAITEHSKLTFNYLLSDREKELYFEITPQEIINGIYLIGRVGIDAKRVFKIEIMKDIKRI